MRIAYLTTDEVNRYLAEGMAAACGLTLCPLAPKDPPPEGEFDAVLYDWDHWPARQRREVMAELRAGCPPHVVALHGYNLEDTQAEALRRRTVGVYRRLQPRVFRFLRRSVLAVPAAGARAAEIASGGNGSRAGGSPGRKTARHSATGQ
jgi:hypothetical protein